MSIQQGGKDKLTATQKPTTTAEQMTASEKTRPVQYARTYDCHWSVPLFFLVFGSCFAIFAITNSLNDPQENKDYPHWHKFGRAVLAGEPLYADVRLGEPEYMYPPTAAVLFYMPLSIMPPFGFVAFLSLLNAAAWAFSAWAATVLAGGSWVRRSFFYTIFPGIAVAPYVWDIQLLGQLNLLLLAMTLGAFLALRHRHPLISSGLFGAAVSMKAFPLSAIAYFVVRREWKAVAASILSILAFVWFFPGMVRGFERNTKELGQWASLMIADQSGHTMAGRSSIGFTRRNQSSVSCAHRLLRHVDAAGDPQKPVYVNLVDITPKAAQYVGYAGCMLLGLVLLVACRFRFAPTLECEGLEMAMVCTLVPLCSPLAWTYFFCWLLPAWAAIGFWIDSPALTPQVRRRMIVGASIAGVLLISAVSEQIDPTLQACGVTMFGSVSLFLTLAYVRWTLPNGVLEPGTV